MGFFGGLGYVLRGARFVYREHPGLARLWLPPVALTAAGLSFALYWVVRHHGAAVDALWALPQGEGLLVGFERALHRVLEALATLVLSAVAVLVVAVSSSVLAAPFNDLLSEEVERLQTGHAGAPISLRAIARDLARAIGLALGKLALYGLVMGALFVVGLVVPGAGTLLYPTVGFAFTALYLAIDYMDWAATRHGLAGRARLAFALGHLRPALGFGVGVWLLLFVPLVDLLFMPAAVAGGTLMFLELQREASAHRR